MRARLLGRWKALPPWARWLLALYMTGFAEGTGDHVRWMTNGGIHAYAGSYPQVPIQVFFVALIVLDPLTAVLVGCVRWRQSCGSLARSAPSCWRLRPPCYG